ncbi:uncharacterized protein B0T15DRAFT_512555 [Chaetomium strumarium]|uniref:Myb-like DNA-binding domain-containing protein n=1 Tax=Chaetomium strumarium TaxID=1170767 RepID=A0AAJ0M0F0_9PEZI|nr:hypothetical protein B0T15DRAFT_512555 [Chaetomium strumarium]
MSPKTIKPSVVVTKGNDTNSDGEDSTTIKKTKYPTPQEAYVFYSVVKHIRGKPDVDWDAMAKDCGFKNAETAKVRYGQIKRKLNIDAWDLTKKKTNTPYEELDYGDGPSTPTIGRTKNVPVTPRTGSSIKKRASAVSKRPGSGRAGRQAKAEAIIKMEQAEQAMGEFEEYEDEIEEADDDELAMTEYDETPTKKSGGLMGNKYIKREGASKPRAAGHATHTLSRATTTAPNYGISNVSMYANFPSVIPDVVLERKAIMVNMAGHWIVSPSDCEAHGCWLARLPASIQSEYHAQSQRLAARAVETFNAINSLNPAAGNSDDRPYSPNPNHRHTVAAFQQYMADNGIPHYSNNHEKALGAPPLQQVQQVQHHPQQMFLPTGVVMQQMGLRAPTTTPAHHHGHHCFAAADQQQVDLSAFANEDGLPRGPFPDYDNNDNHNDDDVDLHSVPLHPSCVQQQQEEETPEAREAREARERAEREQEELDARMLFEGISDSADSESE